MNIDRIYQLQVADEQLEPDMDGEIDTRFDNVMEKLMDIDYKLARECESMLWDMVKRYRAKAYEVGFKDATKIIVEGLE